MTSKGLPMTRLMTKPTVAVSLLLSAMLLLPSLAQADRASSYTYYEDSGLLKTIDGPRVDVSDITTFEYYDSGNLKKITNALGQSTNILLHDLSGRPLAYTDFNDVSSALGYDTRGRLINQNISGTQTDFTYDATGNIETISLSNGEVITYHYDTAHRLTGYSDVLGNKVTYVLDAAGNRTSESVADSDGVLTRSHQYVFDELSRLRKDIGADNQTADFNYDVNNNLTSQVDPKYNVDSFGFDALNRLLFSTDASTAITGYGYDERDNLTSVTDDNGNVTTYTYDGLDNLVSQDSPDTGLTSYSHDEAGNRLTQTDAREVITTYTYDALNRLNSVSYPDTNLNISYTYDENDDSQFGVGKLTSQADNSGTTQYRYDFRGNVTSVITSLGEKTYTTDYRYNEANQLTGMTYPDGRAVDYQYDLAGRLIYVDTTDLLDSVQTLLNEMSYQPFGPLKEQTYGNGLTLTQASDLDYRNTNLSTPAVIERGYGFDDNSNITNISDDITSTNQTFDYDGLDRLTQADDNDALYGKVDYGYDGVHNRTTKDTLIHSLNDSETYAYLESSNILESKTAGNATTFKHDANGNMTDNGSFEFSYGDDNRLHSVTQAGNVIASYSYNAQGQRTHKTVGANTTYFLYGLQGELLSEVKIAEKQLPKLKEQATQLQTALELSQSQLEQVQQHEQTQQALIDALTPQLAEQQTALESLNATLETQTQKLTKLQNNASGIRTWIENYQDTWWAKLFLGMVRSYLSAIESNIETQLAEVALTQQHITTTQQAIDLTTQQLEQAQSELIQAQELIVTLQAQLEAQQQTLSELNLQIADLEQNGEPDQSSTKNYVFANGQLLAMAQDTALFYVHNDHLGTPQTITDQNQDIVWQADYTPFGQAMIVAQEIENNIRFPGQYFDAETNLHYNYFRYYDPSLGRYITSDPIGLAGGINTFGYVGGNPVNLTDLYGLLSENRKAANKQRQARRMKRQCEEGDCPWPVTINWTSLTRPTITKTYSGKCLLMFGLGVKGSAFVGGTVVLDKAPNELAKRGFSAAANAAGKAAAVLNNPVTMTGSAVMSVDFIFEHCTCDNGSGEH
jgi:RHS repeat-associated protein